MRFTPNQNYGGYPCGVVAVGCALGYEEASDIYSLCDELETKDDGYATLREINRLVRSYLKVSKREDFRRGQRPLLKDYLAKNKGKAVICVYGHFLYARDEDYVSFYNNDFDEVVAVWRLKEE